MLLKINLESCYYQRKLHRRLTTLYRLILLDCGICMFPVYPARTLWQLFLSVSVTSSTNNNHKDSLCHQIWLPPKHTISWTLTVFLEITNGVSSVAVRILLRLLSIHLLYIILVSTIHKGPFIIYCHGWGDFEF